MKDWKGRSVLVTGAGGFIGSHLCERLVAAGARVRAFVRYNSRGDRGWLDHSPVADSLEVVRGDVADARRVRDAMDGVDVVFHLAALIGIPYSYAAVESYVDTNIRGSHNVAQAARETGARMVHTSTSEVYGTARYVPIDEAHPLQGQSPYSATKIGADKLVESFHRSFGTEIVIVRPFNTYGPRQSDRAVLPTIISQCLAGQPIRLGNLEATRDMTYVSDTVEGFLHAAASDAAVGRTLNLGTGVEHSVRSMAELVLRLTECEQAIEVESDRMRPKDSEVDRLLAANAQMRELTGWSPQVDFEEGVRRTIEWMRANPERYRPGTYVV